MRKFLSRFFAPPVFPEDDDRTHAAAILNAIGWIIIAVLTTLLLIRSIAPPPQVSSSVNFILAVIILTAAAALFIAHRGYVRVSGFILTAIGWLGLTYLAWSAEGIQDVAFLGYFVPILMAGLLLGWKAAIGFTVASVLSGWFLAYAETIGWLVPEVDTPLNYARYTTGIFTIAIVLIYLMITNLQNALKRSRVTTQELSNSNKELSELRVELEQRVEERTSELKKRASQLEAVSSVARTIALMQDLDTLLPAITQLISQQFGFYHIGIFLLDDQQRNAILRASNSEGGQRMLRQRHTLPVNLQSIVGYSISHAAPRMALDVGTDSIYFDNPDLPETRSEMALPLRVGSHVIGSLDVQSREKGAFSQEDISLLTTLADQVAIAIENARLFSEGQRALEESKALFEKYTKQEWSHFARQAKQTGFVFDGKQVQPLANHEKRQSMKAVAQTGSLLLQKESASIAIPIKLRGQTIGVLDVRSKKGQRQWKQDEITMLEAAAERAALALETARLVDSAQRRAARERAIGDISSKIGAVNNLEAILQTAVEELGRKIGGATEVSLEISTDNDQIDPNDFMNR